MEHWGVIILSFSLFLFSNKQIISKLNKCVIELRGHVGDINAMNVKESIVFYFSILKK